MQLVEQNLMDIKLKDMHYLHVYSNLLSCSS